MEFREIVAQIPEASAWQSAAPLTHRGIGPDKKFLVRDKNHRQLLLRVAEASHLASKQQIFALSSRLWQGSGVAMPEPLSVGQTRDGKHAYILLSFLEGEDFDAHLDALSPRQKYERGLESGRLLQRLHRVSDFDNPVSDWQKHIENQIDELLRWYHELGERIANDEAIIAYLQANLGLMRNRPRAILHNDFHVGNFIIQPDDSLGLIDFDFIRIGDPLEETRMMLYTQSQGHLEIVNGQLHGYCDGCNPGDEFFQVMAFYAAMGIFGSLRWLSQRPGFRGVAHVSEGLEKRFHDFNAFQNPVPNWYRAP